MSAGDTVAVDVCYYGTGSLVTNSVTDTAGNTYTALTKYSDVAAGSVCQWFVSSNIAGNTANVVTGHTASNTPESFWSIQIFEISGLASSPIDADAGTTNASYGTTFTGPPFSTSAASEIILAVGYSAYQRPNVYSAGIIAGSSATLAQTDSVGMSGAEYEIVSSTESSITASINVSTSVTHWGINIVSLKGTAAATPVRHRMISQ